MTATANSSIASLLLDVCIQPAVALKPWYTKNCPHVTAPYAFSPESEVTCSSSRKKNDVCGLISSSAFPDALRDGAIAKPFDPDGARGGRGASAIVVVPP